MVANEAQMAINDTSKEHNAEQGKDYGSQQARQALSNEAQHHVITASEAAANTLVNTKWGLPILHVNETNAAKSDSSFLRNLKYQTLEVADNKDGVKTLATGDYLVNEDGKHTLFTPNGDHITINPDGTHEIKGNVLQISTDNSGVTTVVFGDGAKVSFEKGGFSSVDRDGKSIIFLKEDFFHSNQIDKSQNHSNDRTGWGTGFDGTPGTCPPHAMCLD